MSRPRVFFDHQSFTMQNHGGVSRYFFSLINSLNDCNFETILHAPVHRNYLLKNIHRDASSIQFYLPAGDRQVKYLNFINESLMKVNFKYFDYDIYHPTYYKLPKYINSKLPLVITVYDFVHELFYSDSKTDKTIQRKKDAINRA